jgi:hypothetical protein
MKRIARNPRAISRKILLTSVVGFVLATSARAAVTNDTIKADAAKIAADVALVQADEQKCKDVVEPARRTLRDAREKLRTDAAPLEAKLKADEDQWHLTLVADDAAITSARQAGEAAVHAAEHKQHQEQQAARRSKGAEPSPAAGDAEIAAAHQKLEDDVKTLRAKRKADEALRDQAVATDKSSMAEALKPDTDALHDAQKQFDSAHLFEVSLEADKAALEIDRNQLKADMEALQQK